MGSLLSSRQCTAFLKSCMPPSIKMVNEQQKKFLNRRQLMRRARSRKLRHGRKNILVIGGKIKRITPKQRAAFRKAGMRLRRLARRPSIRRKAARTRQRYERLRGHLNHSVEYSPEFMQSLIEFVRETGASAVAMDIMEAVSPELTSTPIGVYTMDVCEKLDKMLNVAPHFVDAMVVDENSSVFFFQKSDGIKDTVVNCLKPFGDVTLLAQPGDAVSEEEVSQMFVVALEVSPEAMAEVHESSEESGDASESYADVLRDVLLGN